MTENVLPQPEKQRLDALKLYDILDTMPEQELDDIARLASEICHTPIALISFVDEHRQWFKSRIGLNVEETHRDFSFCAHAIHDDIIFEVSDPLGDPRFASNPLVTGYPCIRYYAGAPLVNKDGLRLGTLCVIDTAPHELAEGQKRSLQILSRSVMSLLEMRLQTKEADFFRKALDEIAAVSVTNKTYHYEYVNDKFCALMELPASDIISKNGSELILADLSDQQRDDIIDSMNKREIYRGRVKNQNKKGEVSWSHVAIIPYMNHENEIIKYFTIRIDVTDKMQMVERFEEAEKLANIGSWELNVLTGSKYWSKGLYAIVGFAEDEIPSQAPSLADFMLPEDRAKAEASIAKILNGEEGDDINIVRIFNRQGDLKICSITRNTVRNTKGKTVLLNGTVQDVTERVEIEEQMRKAAEVATEAREMQKNFLSRMSHEIRTPMNGVAGMTNLLRNTQLNDKQKIYVDGIRDSATSMLRIINDILDISKIEAGKIVFEATRFDLRRLVDNVIFTIKPGADDKGIIVASHIDRKIPATLIADPVRLNQILLNLAGNGLKFTDRGSVIITAGLLATNGPEVILEFKVTDTGIGIPGDKLGKIFERFTQAEDHTTRKYGGTGLGLAIARELIEQQGGAMAVESEYGKGTTFSFVYNCRLDSHNAAQELTDPKISDLPHLTGVHVLLVEDNDINQMVAQHTLEHWGARITLAERGWQALELLRSHDFDLVLMDIQMPEMNGIETTRRIRSELGLNIPIIAMTASAMNGERDNCIAAGMNDYFSKPFEPEELNRIIHKHLAARNQGTYQLLDMITLLEVVNNDKSAANRILTMFANTVPALIRSINSHKERVLIKELSTDIHSVKNNIGVLVRKKENEEVLVVEKLLRAGIYNADVEQRLTVLSEKLQLLLNETRNELGTENSR